MSLSSPRWVTVLTGLVMLFAVPLALVVLLAVTRTWPVGLVALIKEPGRLSAVVLLSGGGACVLSALLMGRPAVALVPFAAPLLVAGLITRRMMGHVTFAFLHAAPPLREVALVGTTGEMSTLLIEASSFVAAGCLAFCLASLVGLLAAPRAPRVVGALASAALGLSFFFTAQQLAALREGFTGVPRVGLSDQLTTLAEAIEAWSSAGRLADGLLVSAVLISLVGAVRLRRELRWRALGLLLVALALRGTSLLAERQLVARIDALPAPVVSVPVDARASLIRVALTPGLDREGLIRLLREAHAAHLFVELLDPVPAFEVPRPFRKVVSLLREARAAAPVRVLFEGEGPTPNGDSDLPGLEAPWTGSPSELLRAAREARDNGHVSVVRLSP